MDPVNIVIVICIVLLGILSCLFSGNETAVTTLKPYQWLSRRPQDKDKKKTKFVIKMLSNYSLTVGSILIGNTLSNIICSSLVTVVVENTIGDWFVAIATGILSVLVLIFCEYLPKSLARKFCVGWINCFWWFILFFYYLFWPLCWVFNAIFERDKKATATERDVNYLIHTIQKEGVLEKDEAFLVNNALKFDDIIVSSIMIKDFKYVRNTDSFEKIKSQFVNTNFSRLPVLNSKDKLVGFILSKDILRAYVSNNQSPINFKIKNYIKKMPVVLDTYKLDEVLRTIQRTNSHIIGIVKSSGSKRLLGIVTMEMVIEQLVGQIYDEKDKVNDVQQINSFMWIVDADVNAYNFFKKYLNMKISNKNITVETYLKKTFHFKHSEPGATYQNKKFSVRIDYSQMSNELKYQIIKK